MAPMTVRTGCGRAAESCAVDGAVELVVGVME
jgi:hypothetical protein